MNRFMLRAFARKSSLVLAAVCTLAPFTHANNLDQLNNRAGKQVVERKEQPKLYVSADSAFGQQILAQVQATPTPAPGTTTTTTTTTTQQQSTITVAPTPQQMTSQQEGSRYGQPGFVGEPTNLSVVNADIRDILNYITEQYGVNFVIDRSVGAVPVTVNVTDVPWNVALDAILRANRLGIEVTGNILRVATTEVIAAESTTQQQIRNAQLDNSPLVTEFIRLNYARASGTLAGAAGSSGSFAGGTGGGSFSGGTGGDSTGGGGDQGILPIIARRLSRRGGIEVDGRSNTLIVTDVQENINAVRQLVALLDQPEPQVEIETRIVVATRNFSRDLGVQLAGSVLNPSRGGGASFSTNGGTLSPSGASTLGSTVLGLTTGIFGTAQISLAINAAESKGQAKTIATPRVTALNNRPAQIESGSQIPVVTAQGGAATGGAAVFTTTFISVPLRLSVTPQITDAGTVILRITAENNTVNRFLGNGLGTPGIDTQRMQTEVLVPDGGTTVIGGVLADIENNATQRTPGISGIPILGNLFKQKQTSRQTSEILFFITPRIYRSDYQGRPISGTVSNGTRSVSVPQPVPLGNPSSNTPNPTGQQQTPVATPTTPNPQTTQPIEPTAPQTGRP